MCSCICAKDVEKLTFTDGTMNTSLSLQILNEKIMSNLKREKFPWIIMILNSLQSFYRRNPHYGLISQ